MTAVYAIRHPQTTWNVAERYQGRLEAPLSSDGHRQGAAIVAAFRSEQLDAVVSSPLRRAGTLATQLVEVTGAELIVDQRLTEIGLGAWEGLFKQEISSRYRSIFDAWYERPDTVRFPRGESLPEVRARVLSALERIYECWPGGNVAVVTHTVVIQVMAVCALSMDLGLLHRIRIANGGITTLCGSDAPGALLSLNVTEPLYRSPVSAAAAQHCSGWQPRRITA